MDNDGTVDVLVLDWRLFEFGACNFINDVCNRNVDLLHSYRSLLW